MDKNSTIRRFILPGAFFTTLFPFTGTLAEEGKTPPINADIKLNSQITNQIAQERVLREQLKPEEKEISSKKREAKKISIIFPQEARCFKIDKVLFTENVETRIQQKLRNFSDQAHGKCLGEKGIGVLAHALQNEIIRMGYITTRLNLPDQDLNKGELNFDIDYGKVGKILLNKNNGSYINLTTTLPYREGDIINLSDLEQGVFNLQRVAGSSAKINVAPGQNKNESDIYIDRQQDKYWQVSAWANDAGSVSTGRYQGGAALYLNNLTSLSDTLYFSFSRNIDFSNDKRGSSNKSIGYSVPWGYWWVDLYASQGRYQQYVQGNWSDWMLNNKSHYYSAQLNRLLSHTQQQKSTFGLQVFNNGSDHFYNDTAISIMQKKSAGWKAILEHQHYFTHTVVDASLSYQKKMPWFGSSAIQEQKHGVADREGRIVMLDVQASTTFSVLDEIVNYAPHFNLQLTPDHISSIDSFAIGNRWTVRGFDGRYSLQENQGWYWRNDLTWLQPGKSWQPYLGLDIGQVLGKSSQDYSGGKTLVGSIAGLRGRQWRTNYELFAGIPLAKPAGFHADPLTLGFSLRWNY